MRAGHPATHKGDTCVLQIGGTARLVESATGVSLRIIATLERHLHPRLTHPPPKEPLLGPSFYDWTAARGESEAGLRFGVALWWCFPRYFARMRATPA